MEYGNVKIKELKVDENCFYLPGDNSSIIAAVALIKTTSINIMLEMFRHLFIDIVKGWARCCRSIVVILNGMHALCSAQNTQNVCRFVFGKSVAAMTSSLFVSQNVFNSFVLIPWSDVSFSLFRVLCVFNADEKEICFELVRKW